MENDVLLSICIPTNGVVEWVLPVIESIYSPNVSLELFEVVITDNGEKDDLQKAVKEINYPNFYYYRTTAKGFTNQIECFRKANGVFRKMLNHRSCLLPNSLNKMIEVVNKYRDSKPVLYFAEGRSHGDIFVECSNLNQFLETLTYFVSWSAGVGVWASDLEKIDVSKADVMFPHLVYLLDENLGNNYVIWNEPYEEMADDKGKGGYDFFKTFAVHFLDIIKDLEVKNKIDNSTFTLIKDELYYLFLREIYLNDFILPSKHTYIFQNIKERMMVYYSVMDYYKMVMWASIRYPYRRLKMIVKA